MSPPKCQVNNFVQPKRKKISKIKATKIDLISKIFIILDLCFGVHRTTLITASRKFFTLMIFYYILINAVYFYACLKSIYMHLDIRIIIDICQFFMFTTLGSFLHPRLFKFYDELNKFDFETGTKVQQNKFVKDKISEHAKYNICFLLLTVGLSLLFYCIISDKVKIDLLDHILVTVLMILQALELHYYGHLFSLMIPRLKLIINHFKFSYPNRRPENLDAGQEIKNIKKPNNKQSHVDLKKLTYFYDKIIITYDYLNCAIKWQMVTLLSASFVITLIVSYFIVKDFISATNSKVFVYFNMLALAIRMTHILSPCIFADKVYTEACSLKEMLACRLYENTLDKSSRSDARTLLALIETRDLSFSLFHMFNVDISLPFKFLGLLLTYLVIILQFDKVINPLL